MQILLEQEQIVSNGTTSILFEDIELVIEQSFEEMYEDAESLLD